MPPDSGGRGQDRHDRVSHEGPRRLPEVHVTSPDGHEVVTHALTVTRTPATNAALRNLTLSAPGLVFGAGTQAYSVVVEWSVAYAAATPTLDFVPTTGDPPATLFRVKRRKAQFFENVSYEPPVSGV